MGPAAAPRFDEIIHGVVRLRVCGMLARLGATDFPAIRDALGVSDPTLSKHLKQLEQAGYVRLQKRPALGGRTRTWIQLTEEGDVAFQGHVAFLREATADRTVTGDAQGVGLAAGG